jgi:DNA-binding NarL/FixJ family response regulator
MKCLCPEVPVGCPESSGVVNSKKIRLLIVDDHPVVRDGLAAMLSYQPDMEVVAQADTGLAAIDGFERQAPDITLMDLSLPGMSGVDAMLAIRRRNPKARIIVLTTFSGDIHAIKALKAGAAGYLLKDASRADLLDTIRKVHRGDRCVPATVAAAIAEHAGDEALTNREVEVLRHVAAGNSNKVVAHRLCVSEDTVKAHMRNILFKLCASDRTHAVTIATQRGFFAL